MHASRRKWLTAAFAGCLVEGDGSVVELFCGVLKLLVGRGQIHAERFDVLGGGNTGDRHVSRPDGLVAVELRHRTTDDAFLG